MLFFPFDSLFQVVFEYAGFGIVFQYNKRISEQVMNSHPVLKRPITVLDPLPIACHWLRTHLVLERFGYSLISSGPVQRYPRPAHLQLKFT